MRKIILEENEAPKLEGMWKIGEVLQMSQMLANWVQSLEIGAEQVVEEQEEPDK